MAKSNFSIQELVRSSTEYAKAMVRSTVYHTTETTFSTIGSVLATLLLLILVPFFLLALLFAGTFGIAEWLHISLGWSFLIMAGIIWIVMFVLLLLHKPIKKSITAKLYKKALPKLAEMDQKLAPTAPKDLPSQPSSNDSDPSSSKHDQTAQDEEETPRTKSQKDGLHL